MRNDERNTLYRPKNGVGSDVGTGQGSVVT